jgi:hypothetical protein
MSPYLRDPGQRIPWRDRLAAGKNAETGVVLVLATTVIFGIIAEIGGAFSRALAEGRISLAELWGSRLFGLALFLLGLWMLRAAHRRLLELGMTPAEVRKAEWAWAIGLGLGMLASGGMGLIWLVNGVDVEPEWHVHLSGQPGALPMAVAFAVYSLAGALLFLVGAVLHLRIRTGTPRP